MNITRTDIERWGEQYNAKCDLPHLILKLIRATTPISTKANFPLGSAVNIGGWDGKVLCEIETSFVPQGISLYEIGTERNCKKKATEDYNKRKIDPLGYDPKVSTFIFITSRFWRNKNKWIKEKEKECCWKNVIVYDSSNLEQWLDITPAVTRWFSQFAKILPSSGVMTTNEFWDEWSKGPSIQLLPRAIISGRESEREQLLKFVQGDPNIKGIRASTKEEAIAFIIACAKDFPKNESEYFFSRSLIIDNEGTFRNITIINNKESLILIPNFENKLPLYTAVSNGHHVIVPLGAEDDFTKEITIILSTIDRKEQINSLIDSGIYREDAEKYSRESVGNITILRKLLKFPSNKTRWANTQKIHEIIPALLVGRWSEEYSGDITVIEKLSKLSYSDYSQIISNWAKIEDSPLIEIGKNWRLISPLNLWATISQYLTQDDLKSFQECFFQVFKDLDNEYKKKLLGQKTKYSSWLKEGLSQSLILIGRYGTNISCLSNNAQGFVDDIVYELLNNASGKLWASFDQELPLIAEASPNSFLTTVISSLKKEGSSEIMEMFKEHKDIFSQNISNYTGLLWALEGLAWMPDYLKEVSLILLKLSRLDPGGSLSNRPINSITEIYKPWHYQTLASYDERMEILKYITSTEKESGWNLLIRMLPQRPGCIAFPIHKMRWRIFDINTNLTYNNPELYKTYSYVVDLLIDLFDNSEEKFSQLIDKSVDFLSVDRVKFLNWAESIYRNIQQKSYISWECVRKILYNNKLCPDAKWALSENELEPYERLYKELAPTDVINKYIWLFNCNWPEIQECADYNGTDSKKKYNKILKKIEDNRIDAIKRFISDSGLVKTIELRKKVKETFSFGAILATVISKEDEVLKVCICLNDDKIEYLDFVYGFFNKKSCMEGFEWIKNLLKILQQKKFSNIALANMLLYLNQSEQLWTFISSLDKEVQKIYWLKMRPSFFSCLPIKEAIFGIKKLIEYKRFFSAIDVCSLIPDKIPNDIFINLLECATKEKAYEEISVNGYELDIIFQSLDKRKNISKDKMIELEWLYLPFMKSMTRKPEFLYERLISDPAFFVTLLKLIYLPENEDKIKENKKEIDKISYYRAVCSLDLLNSWKKIPGMNPDNSIDKDKLLKWIKKARELASDENRLDVADIHIGHILAQYPENIPEWPQESIFQILEEINSDIIYNDYSAAMYNKMGATVRGPFDGGDIERKKANYFKKLADDFECKYPRVSKMFRDLSNEYLSDAKRIDEEAKREELEY
jgi:hypothetical protein